MNERIAESISEAIRSNPRHLKAEAIADRMLVNRATLYKWGTTEAVIPLERLLQLIWITGDTRPIAAVCEAAGGVFIPNPSAIENSAEDVANAKTLREFSEFMTETARSTADGDVTSVEAARIRKEGHEAMRAIAELVRHFEKRAEAGS